MEVPQTMQPAMQIQFIMSKIQSLLADKVKPTQPLHVLDIIKEFSPNELTKIMPPTGFEEVMARLDATPTTFKYG
jgi:hypothetical protein